MPFFNSEENIQKTQHKLPHWQQDRTWVFVTYRLADSLPNSKLLEWKQERQSWLKLHPKPWTPKTEATYHQRFSQTIDLWLDRGHGECLLKHPENSAIVAKAFHHFDGDRYDLSSFVVMPNHIHALFSPREGHQLCIIIHSWKRYSAKEINQRLNRSGSLWQPDYWDRLIRSQEHFDWANQYISENPKRLQKGEFQRHP